MISRAEAILTGSMGERAPSDEGVYMRSIEKERSDGEDDGDYYYDEEEDSSGD